MGTNGDHQPDETRMLNVRLTHALLERLRVIAESEHRTMSQEVRRLIERHVAAADEDETS